MSLSPRQYLDAALSPICYMADVVYYEVETTRGNDEYAYFDVVVYFQERDPLELTFRVEKDVPVLINPRFASDHLLEELGFHWIISKPCYTPIAHQN